MRIKNQPCVFGNKTQGANETLEIYNEQLATRNWCQVLVVTSKVIPSTWKDMFERFLSRAKNMDCTATLNNNATINLNFNDVFNKGICMLWVVRHDSPRPMACRFFAFAILLFFVD